MRSALILLAGATVGCASGEPGPPTQTEIREDLIVQVLDGDFVRFGGARRPLDAVVLELRQLVRCRTVHRGRLVSRATDYGTSCRSWE
jgi:hypothetical protein